MRKLMWFAVGFALSCGLRAYFPANTWRIPLLLSAGLCMVFRQERMSFRRAGAAFLGLVAGTLWFGCFARFYLSAVEQLDGTEPELTFTASDYSYETDYGGAVEGVFALEGKEYKLRAYLEEGTQLLPGDRVTGVFRIRLTTPEGGKASSYHQGEGIFLLADQRGDLTVVRPDEVPVRFRAAVLRQTIQAILSDCFDRDVTPFVKALLLGDTSDLDYATDTSLKISGIRHIVAVSGLHISILYSLILLITMRRRFLTALVGIPVLLLFAAVAGFTPSVTRACIMVSLMMLAQALDREYDPATALGFFVLVMLAVNPLAVVSVSLQLSVLCVAGIMLFNTSIQNWLKSRLPERTGAAAKLQALFCSSISVSLSSMSLVTPLCACYFGTVSLVSVLTNLLTLWIVNLVFHGIAVVCLLYPVFSGAARLLAATLAWPARLVLAAAELLASVPLAAVYTKSGYIIAWLVFVYLLLAVFLLMKKKQPAALLCCGTIGLCIALLASWAEPAAADTQITMLDVGQGQAILLQSDGKTYLVDCGGDDDEKTADIIAETLLSQGVNTLDGIILTHYDRDHSGGLCHLLSRIGTDYLFLPDTQNELTPPQRAGKTVFVWEDLELTFGGSRLMIYGPVYSGLDNENSLCVLFDTEKCDILITGDRSAFGERMLLRKKELPDVDILVAGHHGAADSSSEELLKAVAPETVLISVAADNIYGHPAPSLLQRLENFGCTVLRTDQNGTITIRR